MEEANEESAGREEEPEAAPGEKLSAEQRSALIERLSAAKTREFITRQGEIVTDSINDVRSQTLRRKLDSTGRKRYACNTYGKDFELAGTASNYCVAIQFDAMNRANREIGRDLRADLEKDMPGEAEGLTNPLFLKTKDNLNVENPVCTRDSVRCGEARYCPETIRKYASAGCVENAACRNDVTVSSFVDGNGMVRKDKNGRPKLKDGDLLFVKTGTASNTASGLHCIRANVSEDGKVTYTAGNNDRIKGSMSWYLNKPVSVFHTGDYAQKCFMHQFEKLNDDELLRLDAQLNEERQTQQQDEASSLTESRKTPETEVQISETERPDNMERLSASMSAGHSAMSERIAAFRQRRNAESLKRADLVSGMRADNERLQQKREELAGMRGGQPAAGPEFMFASKHYQCEDIAAAVREEERQPEVRQQEREPSALRRFMGMFSRSEYA